MKFGPPVAPATPTTVELNFKRPAPAVSENEIRGKHWADIERRLLPWKQATQVAWMQLGAGRNEIAGVPCRVQMVIPFTRHGRRDAHNYTGSVVKACVDVLVRHGCFPDDSPEWVEIVDPELVVGEDVIIRLMPKLTEGKLGTRAVLRTIEPGNEAMCPCCGARVKFAAQVPKKMKQRVIVNVYENGRWNRTEQYHLTCYEDAGEPYGKASA